QNKRLRAKPFHSDCRKGPPARPKFSASLARGSPIQRGTNSEYQPSDSKIETRASYSPKIIKELHRPRSSREDSRALEKSRKRIRGSPNIRMHQANRPRLRTPRAIICICKYAMNTRTKADNLRAAGGKGVRALANSNVPITIKMA